MTVRELIEKLKEMPGDYQVVFLYDGGYGSFLEAEITKTDQETVRIKEND